MVVLINGTLEKPERHSPTKQEDMERLSPPLKQGVNENLLLKDVMTTTAMEENTGGFIIAPSKSFPPTRNSLNKDESSKSTPEGGNGVVDEQYNGSVSKRKSMMNDKIAFSIRVQEQLFKMDYSLLNIPISNYEEFETVYLAEGFFGTTYKACHKATREVLVLKVLKDYEDDECISQFLDEIRLCCRLVHPNIIKTKGITFNNDGRVCCLLEYIDGYPLLDLIDSHSSPHPTMDAWLTYLNITLDMARGMNYLHNNGVIHRDLNSKNVLCREIRKGRYEAIIIDFGLSYQKHDWSDLNEEGPSGCVGSPYHIAPELFDDRNCSTKSDVFSFGILMCEMISGIPGANPDELPRSKDFGLDEKEFTELVHNCPPKFLNLAVRCCQSNPKRRPQFCDIIKMVDFIIDCIYEAIAKSESDGNDSDGNEHGITMTTTTTTSARFDLTETEGNNDTVATSDTGADRGDEYVLDSYLLCSCNGVGRHAKNSILRNDTFRTTYDRHGDIQRTSSRRVTRKIFRRCSFCAGRVLVSNGDDGTPLHDDVKLPTMSQTPNDDAIISQAESHVTSEIVEKSPEFVKNELDDMGGKRFDGDRSKLKLTLGVPPTLVIKSPSPPPDSLQITSAPMDMPSPGLLNHYASSEQQTMTSPKPTSLYQAGSLLRQSKYEISTRTSQLVEHTPNRLHTFFTHLLRKRNHGNKHHNNSHHNQNESSNTTMGTALDEKRGSKINLHKIFYFSSSSPGGGTSPKNTSNLSPSAACNSHRTVASSSSCDGGGGGGVTDQPSGGGGKRRFTFGRTLKISQKEYISRRKSMPIQLYRRRGSSIHDTADSPVKDTETCRFPQSQTKSYSALGSLEFGGQITTRQSRNSFASSLRRNKKTKSHDALNQSDSDLQLVNQSEGRTNSHDSLTDQSDSVISQPEPVSKSNSKKSRSLMNLFRKKSSH